MIFEAPPVARGNDRLLTVCAPRKAAGLRSGGRSRWANWLVSLPFSAKLAQREHFDASAAPGRPNRDLLQGLGPRCGDNGTARPKAAGDPGKKFLGGWVEQSVLRAFGVITCSRLFAAGSMSNYPTAPICGRPRAR